MLRADSFVWFSASPSLSINPGYSATQSFHPQARMGSGLQAEADQACASLLNLKPGLNGAARTIKHPAARSDALLLRVCVSFSAVGNKIAAFRVPE